MHFSLPFLLLVTSVTAWRDKCESFNLDATPFVRTGAATVAAELEYVSLVASTYYENTARVNLTSGGGSIDSNNLVGFCRLELSLATNKTSGNSAVTEVWLPDDWNGRILGTGNGGWNGGIVYDVLALDGVGRGFASFSTNTGHNSTALDGSWALGNPNAIVDFGWRGLHLSVGAAKAITARYYGQEASKSYYLGCSTGGRQGLKEIQDFPDDFDGAVLGAPANPMSLLLPWELRTHSLVTPVGSPQWIPATLYTVIHDEVLRQCDHLDGLVDGIVSHPRLCTFRPETLTCLPGASNSTCLTLAQVSSIKKVYTDWVDDAGNVLFSRLEPGGELGYGALLGENQFPIAVDYYKYLVLNDSKWDPTTLNASTIQLGRDINPGNIDALKTDLTPFAKRGGKVLHYIGMSDNLIAPGNSLAYYNQVEAATRASSGTDIDSFYRLFEVPGMTHCGGGEGANAFGGNGQRATGAPPGQDDARHDIVQALINWVEKDDAPVELIATKWQDNNATVGWDFTRRLCKYPLRSYYVGGDEKSWESFECR